MAHPQLDVTITDADITAHQANVAATEAQFPFLLNLTVKEAKELPKMGPKRIAKTQKLLDIALQNPGIIAAGFSVPAFEKDFKAAIRMKGLVRNPVLKLLEKIDETGHALGNEAYEQALKVKIYLETANRTDAGLDDLVREVNELFEQGEDEIVVPPAPVAEPV